MPEAAVHVIILRPQFLKRDNFFLLSVHRLCSLCIYCASGLDMSLLKHSRCQLKDEKLMKCLFFQPESFSSHRLQTMTQLCLLGFSWDPGSVRGFTLCECTSVTAFDKEPHSVSNRTMHNERATCGNVKTGTIWILVRIWRDSVGAAFV